MMELLMSGRILNGVSESYMFLHKVKQSGQLPMPLTTLSILG